MRGTPAALLGSDQHRGIIPAHAGNTGGMLGSLSGGWDHPRACGEHPHLQDMRGSAWGSSPRMRGTLRGSRLDALGTRIIPAHAGNTLGRSPPSRSNRDHPRACGEHFPLMLTWGALEGSSPRMRGTHKASFMGRVEIGIIPAHAGNTWMGGWKPGVIGDHPRACGEHVFRRALVGFGWGSSPRMRGTL